MCFLQLPSATSAGVLAVIGTTILLATCARNDSSTASGAHMLDDSLLSYQVRVALGQDMIFSTRQIHTRSNPDDEAMLTGWVDTPEVARRVGEDVKRLVDPVKLDNQLRVLLHMQAPGDGPYILAGLSLGVPASAPVAR